jgi:murein DD-endopeptidase MepM/ murein hydrolase activator NlpD
MKLLEPLLVGPYSITQKFGGNANPYYAGEGLKGHPGVDLFQGFDRSITASHDGLVYKTFNKDNPDLSKYRAVCVIFQENEYWYELTYGHCNKVYASVGDMVRSGDLLASMGNTGDVYSLGLPVSVQNRLSPKHPGTHLHYQLRKCLRVATPESGKYYLQDERGDLYHDSNGYYEIVNYDNGYHGCIDPLPYLYSPTSFGKLPYFIHLVSQLAAFIKGRTS